jgi:hypothetical protein
MLVDAQEKTMKSILEAIGSGRFHSVQTASGNAVEISSWSLSCGGVQTFSGGTVTCANPQVNIGLRDNGGNPGTVTLTVVRNGKIRDQKMAVLPADLSFQEAGNTEPQGYYRIMAQAGNAMAYSNPIFYGDAQ